jgi:hypothetical protein
MLTHLIMEKMTEIAGGKFTYMPLQDAPSADITNFYSSLPVYFGLMGTVVGNNQGSVLDFSLPKPIDPKNKIYLVMRQNDVPVALLNCIIDYPEDGSVLLGWLLVHGQHLFQGIGRSNYNIFSEAVSSIGMKQIHILIEAHNDVAITFWEGVGFKKTPGSAQKAAINNNFGIEYYFDLQDGNGIAHTE